MKAYTSMHELVSKVPYCPAFRLMQLTTCLYIISENVVNRIQCSKYSHENEVGEIKQSMHWVDLPSITLTCLLLFFKQTACIHGVKDMLLFSLLFTSSYVCFFSRLRKGTLCPKVHSNIFLKYTVGPQKSFLSTSLLTPSTSLIKSVVIWFPASEIRILAKIWNWLSHFFKFLITCTLRSNLLEIKAFWVFTRWSPKSYNF